MSFSISKPMVLLIHDGELAEIRELLEEMRIIFVERGSAARAPKNESSWSLIIGGPRQLVKLRFANKSAVCPRVAVTDDDSRTMRAMLRRTGVEMIVRRPVHRAALRLLILHSLYSGPEKRRQRRVSVGTPIRFRTGLRRYGAVLVEISSGGCRMLATHSVESGKRVRVSIPPVASVESQLNLNLSGTVMRCIEASGESPDTVAISLRFGKLSKRSRKKLAELLSAYAQGPAALDAESLGSSDGDRADLAAAGSQTPTASPGEASSEVEERRGNTRHSYDRRVIALDQEATRVLLGRDISAGGMRVDSNHALAVGDHIRLALHVQTHRAPLVVSARIVRDDGEEGMVLRFFDITEDQAKSFTEAVEALPALELGDGSGAGLVVSEIIEHSPPRR